VQGNQLNHMLKKKSENQ